MKVIPPEKLQSLERHFHGLVRQRACEGEIPCPPLEELKLDESTPTKEDDRAWFPVPGMYGGFAYWLDLTGNEPKLITESWCRVAEGSGQRHEIDSIGCTLVAEGFV